MKTLIFTLVIVCTLITTPTPTFSQHFTDNKAQHDSLVAILDQAEKNGTPISWELLKMALAVNDDNTITLTLQKGHKQYVSMPKVKNGIMREVLSRLDNLEAGQGGLIHESATETGETSSVPAELSDVKRRVDEIEELIVNPDVKCQDKIIEAMKYRFHKRNGKFKLPRYK